jgi:hypothetical protein
VEAELEGVEEEIEGGGGGFDGKGGERTDVFTAGEISVLFSFPLKSAETGAATLEVEVVAWVEEVSIGIEVVAGGVSTTFAAFLTRPKN